MQREDAKMKKARRGFTLIEMMIAVVLIGIVALMTLPNVIGRLPEYRLTGVSWKLTADMKLARIRAITQGVPAQLDFSHVGEGRYSIWTDNNKNGIKDTGEVLTTDFSDKPDVRMWCWPQNGRFYPDGSFSGGSESWEGMMWLSLWANGVWRSYWMQCFPSGLIVTYSTWGMYDS